MVLHSIFMLLCCFNYTFLNASENDYNNHPTITISKADLKLSIYKDFILTPDSMLCPIFPQHSSYLYPIFTNPAVMRYFWTGNTKSIPEIDLIAYNQAQRNIQKTTTEVWLIISHDGAAGEVALSPTNTKNAKELWYALSPQFHGRGIAAKASRIAMNFMGSIYQYQATVNPNNFPSIAVLKKLGFVKDEAQSNQMRYNAIRDHYTLEPLQTTLKRLSELLNRIKSLNTAQL